MDEDRRTRETVPLDAVPPGPAEAGAERIGPYRLLREIGRGGMGVVYEAAQEHPVRRRVALKRIQWGMDTRRVVARFDAERQAMAMMDHPSIAKVFDAGATEDGRPYFVMEYVPGEPLVAYCDTRRLSLASRLELFVRVCQGVQHAHQKGVIHRDLKPSNILVAEVDRAAHPKIIDFGIAKAIEQQLTEHTLQTELGQVVGTLEYMSPEQAELANPDVDTRADVFSLGVVLFELLAGTLPIETGELRRSSLDAALRLVRQADPPRPSARVAAGGTEPEAVRRAAARASDPARLVRQLRGDLDWIVMTAIEKDRARRYATVNALAQDVRRHLDHEPVSAGAPTTWYRVRKFARRHRTGVAAAAVLATALLLGTTGATVGLLRARRAERVAVVEAATSRQVADFLVGLFEVSDPGSRNAASISAQEILDRGAERIERELADQPEVRARMMATIGRVYRNLGSHDDARRLLEEALATRRATLGEASAEVADVLNQLAWLEYVMGHRDAARTRYEEARLAGVAARGPDDPLVAESIEGLAILLKDEGRLVEARPLYERALKIREAALGPRDPRVALSLNNLGILLWNLGEHARARATHERALDIRREVLGPEHLDVAVSQHNLAVVLVDLGEADEARRLYEQSLAIKRAVLGPRHRYVASGLNNLGDVLLRQGELAAAREQYEAAFEIWSEALGPRHEQLAWPLSGLAEVAAREGDAARARESYARALEIRAAALGDRHPQTLDLLVEMGGAAAASGEHDEALRLLRRAVENGFADPAPLRSAPWTALRGTPEFDHLLEKMPR